MPPTQTAAASQATRAGGAFHMPLPRARRGAGAALSTMLCWLSVVAAFAISHLALQAMGFSYEVSGGPAWQKLSPATYFAFAALAALAVERGPAGLIDDIVRRNKGALVLTAAWAMLIWYVLFIRPQPITTTIDTFAFPVALYLVLIRQGEMTLKRLGLFIHVFMAMNALLGLAEFMGGFRLTPIIIQDVVLTEWRSSAFMGHPLMNALAAGSYAVALMMGGGRDLPPWLRGAALGLQLLAMPIFGGRAATALLFLFAAACAVRFLYQVAAGRRFSHVGAAVMALALPALAVGIALLFEAGFFDKFVDRFINDEGSASSRIVMFEVMGRFSFEDLLVGPDLDVLASLQRAYGIAFGIESFWVALVAYYGLLITVPLLVGLFAFLGDVAGKARPQAWWVAAFFIAVCSTSLSLAGKGTMLGVLVIIMVVLMRRDGSEPVRRAA